MAIVIKPITLEVSKPNVFQAIAAKQGDSNSRFLKTTIVNEGEKIFITSGATVTINAKRSDGQSNGFFGEVNNDGTVTVPIHSWILELPGNVDCDVSVIEEDSKLTTTTFSLLVEEASHNSDDVSEEKQYDFIAALTNEVLKSVENKIVQTTGDSENVVMSQKATTDRFDVLENLATNDIFFPYNKIEAVWEQGSINGYGEKTSSPLRIRTDYINVENYNVINTNVDDGYLYGIAQYKYSGGTYTNIKVEDWLIRNGYVLDSQTTHIIVYLRKSDNSEIGPSESNHITLSYYKKDGLAYGSKTNNLLDTSRVFKSFRLTDTLPCIVNNTNDAIISHFIYVGDKSKLTIHSLPVTSNSKWVCFTTDRSLDASSVVSVVKITAATTDTTISVANGAKWVLITLGFGNDDFSNTTVCYGDTYTSDEYGKGDVLYIDETPLQANNSAGAIDEVYSYEKMNLNKRFIPYSIGTPANNNHQANKSYERTNFVFFTDSHIDLDNPTESFSNVEDTVRFVKESPISFDGIIHGGDIITQTGAKATIKNNAMAFFNKAKEANVPVVFAKGNHDLNDYSVTPSNAFNDSDWGEMFLDYAETQYGIVRQTKSNGSKSTWHYLDYEDKKIRVISIDTQDTDKTETNSYGYVLYAGGKAWYISNEQLNWVASTALNFDDKADKGWGVVVVMHQSLTLYDDWAATSLTPAYESSIEKFFNLLAAFNTQSTYSNHYSFDTNEFYNIDLDADFTRYTTETNKPHIICVLNGHEHTDRSKVYQGINIIWTANGSATNEYSDGKVARILGTSTQNCFDILNIDTTHRKIRMFRFGAGTNCYGEGGDRFLPEGLSY